MSFYSIPPTPSAPFETVTFSITTGEFRLLSGFMAPLGINESTGESVWVTGGANGVRQWIATGGEITAVIGEAGLNAVTQSHQHSFEWAFPVAEHVLVLLGKLFTSTEDISLTISDDHIRIVSANYEVTIPQVQRLLVPPLPPIAASSTSVTVSAADLLIMLSSAASWPAGGATPDHEPIVSCAFDVDHQQFVISPHWGDETIGQPQYRIPATLNSSGHSVADPVKFTPFNLLHTAIGRFLRDPLATTRLGDITIHQPVPGEHHHCLSGPQWIVHLPVVPDIEPWGQNLEELLPDTHFFWVDSHRVRLVFPELAPGHLNLEAIAPTAASASHQYRLTYEILSDVVPTISLYDEINDFNRLATGCQLVIDDSRLVARLSITEREFVNLGDLVASFIQGVAGLTSLFAVLAL